MGATWRRVAWGALVVLATLVGLYAVVVFAFAQVPTWTAATEVCRQPDTVTYDDGRAYAVFVRTPTLTLALSDGDANAVVSTAGDGSRGVFVELNPSTDPDRVHCTWNQDGVEIVEPNGITHAVPARVFAAGR